MTDEPAKQQASGCLIGCLVVVLGGIGLAALLTMVPESEEGKEERRRISAMLACERAVEARLKAPASASFGGVRETGFSVTANGGYRVLSHVDAQNTFGAKIRTRFICVATETGKDAWRVESVVFDW